MTNKDKIEEIAQSFRTARMFSKHPCEIAEDAAQRMAVWKDEQFKELLNTLSLQSNIYEVYKLINMYKEILL